MELFKHLPGKFARVFSFRYLPWHLLAIGVTTLLVLSDFDWRYFLQTRGSLLLALTLPAAIIGFFVPILVPVGMYLWGEFRSAPRLVYSAIIVGQAELIGILLSFLYKAFTGRIQPEFYTFTSTLDISKEFQFGLLRHGVFWGWPSSHTTVAFAMAVSLIALYPENKFIRYAAPLYAFYIGIGVSVSIHWFSDFIAGAIFGTLVGVSFVRSLRNGPAT